MIKNNFSFKKDEGLLHAFSMFREKDLNIGARVQGSIYGWGLLHKPSLKVNCQLSRH